MTAPHTILGIREDATRDEIRMAWRSLVRRSHPDLAGCPADSLDRIKAINAAHDAMLDALARAKRSAESGRHAAAWPEDGAAGAQAAPGGAQPCRRRMMPSAVASFRMRAGLAARLRHYLNRESARLGGAAYTVPGQPGWQNDDAVLASGGLPKTHLVCHIDFVGRTLMLELDARPEPGRILVALPRLVQEDARVIRQTPAATVLDVDVPPEHGARLKLSEDLAARCVVDGRALTVVLSFPSI